MRRLWRRRTKQHEATHYSVLDLGASSVKALVIERAEDRVSILGRGQAFHQNGIAAEGMLGSVEALGTACEQALTQAEDATEAVCGSKIVPDALLMSVPVTWVRGAIGIGRVQRPNLEESITAKECVGPTVQSGQRAMQRLAQAVPVDEWSLLDAAIVAFRIDGHRVTDPVGFRGHLLETQSFAVAAPKRLLGALSQIADTLHFDPPYLAAEPQLLASAAPSDGLVIQVGAETTGVVLARYGAPLAFTGIHSGGQSLVQAVVDTFQVSPARADALLRACAAGRLSGKGQRAIRNAIEVPIETWLATVKEGLRSWDRPSEGWPLDIYLCGGLSALADVQSLVSSVQWLDVLPFSRTPRVRTWDGSNLGRVTDRTGSGWLLENVTTVSLAAWALRERDLSFASDVLHSSLKIRPRR